ncbi:MAG: hypothetical protein ACLS20_06175 [Faecalimonas umbilicata]|uniref:hypothetical protein n=1 Tax=Faecalimonas umbilicata TaxID=1912855 RepID=UPI0039915ECC
MLQVNSLGFKIDGKWYCIGDVLKCHDTKIKRIILFGFYDNGLDYEDHDYGCGFYTVKVKFINNEWVLDRKSVSSIEKYLLGEKEENKNIIMAVQETVKRGCACMDENGRCTIHLCENCDNIYAPCDSYIINKPYFLND